MANKKMPHESKKRLISGIAVALVGFILLGFVGNLPEKEEPAPALIDGTYTSSAQGIFSAVKVSVTVADGVISDCTIDASGETPDIGGAAAPALQEAILAAQSASVDTVAGATMTSNAVISAMEQNMARAAAGEVDPEASFIDGVYTSSAQGIFSEVSVQIVVVDGLIAECNIDASGETPDIGGAAAPVLAEAIATKMNANLDAVAGATMTSNAIQQAAADVIARAIAGEVDPEPQGLADGDYAVKATIIDTPIDMVITIAEGEIAKIDVEDDAIEKIVADAKAEVADLKEQLKSALSSAAEYVLGEVEASAPETYTAAASGISSDVVVTVTVENGVITDAIVDVSGETPGIGAAAGDALASQILEAQSEEISGVSGATITSDAAKKAMEEIVSAMSSSAAEEPVAEAASAPETYTAAASGISSDVVVTVTVENGVITDAIVDVSGETPGIGAAAGDALAAQILEAQSAEISGVSGATITSDAAKKALSEIFAQIPAAEEASVEAAEPKTYTASATGISSDVVVTMTFIGDELTEVTVDVSGETPGIGAAAGDALVAQIVEAQSAEIDGVSGATITSDAAKKAVADCFAQKAADQNVSADGAEAVYTASASGISSEVVVTLTVNGKEITKVEVDVSGETPGIGAAAGDALAAQIMKAQSAEIDGVAGATITSNAAKNAVQACLDQVK